MNQRDYRRVKYTRTTLNPASTMSQFPLFGITEVYYNKDGVPESYVDPDDMELLTGHDELLNINAEYDYIKDALDKPIIDLDNFPNEYTE